MRKILIVTIIALLILGCAKKPDTDTLLKLGNKYYSLLDFFETNSKNQFVKIPEENKIKQIETWAENQLMLKAAEDKDYFNKNDKIKEEMEKYRKQADIKYYLDRAILDSIITEEILVENYEKQAVEVNASHILLWHNGIKPKMQRTKQEALDLAQVIIEKAEAGEDFAALSKKYSEDEGSKETGSLGYFGPGKMVKAFEDVAFSLNEGEISNPVESQFGIHIIKLIDKRKKPQKPFEEERKNLTNKLIAQFRPQLQSSYKAKVDEIKNKYDFEINQEMVDTLIVTAEKYKKANPTNQNIYVDSNLLNELTIPNAIGKFEGKEISLQEFATKLKTTHMQLPPSFINTKYFVPVMENVYMSELFLKEFKESSIQYDDEYDRDFENYKRRIMTQEFKKELLNTESEVSEAEIKKYYDDNKDERYKIPSRAETREIFLYDSTEAAKLLEDVLEDPEKFDSFSEQLTQRYNQKEKPGHFGNITPKQYGQIGVIANQMEPNTIHPELIKAGKGWSMVKVYSKTESSLKELEKVKESIKRVLLQQKKTENEKAMMQKLKNQYKMKIYWDCVNIEKK